jgi:hypothetical protein
MGFPPTSSKLSTDTSNVTTFNYQFPNFTGTHTGITMSLLVNSIAGGGTGATTASGAYNALSPMTTAGDIEYELTAGTAARLPIGTNGQVLSVVSGLPAWATFTPTFSGLTPNAPVIALTSSTITTTTTGTAGQVFTSAGSSSPPGWQTLSGTAAFASFTSNIVNTLDTGVTSSTFVTFSNSPAFTITPSITGTYKVYCSIPLQSSGTISIARIFNTSGGATLLAESQTATYNTAGDGAGCYSQSVYALTAGTTYVFNIQGKVSGGGTANVRGDIAPFYMFAEGVQLGSPAGTGTPMSFSTYLNTAVTTPANSPVIYDTILFDTNSGYSTSTGLYTIPSTGDWQFNFSGSSSGLNINAYVQINGTTNYLIGETGSKSSSGSVILPLIAGNTVAIVPDTTVTMSGSSGSFLFLFIFRR